LTRYPTENDSSSQHSLQNTEKKKELLRQDIQSATPECVAERKISKAVQRKLRAEINAEVEMAVKDGRDPIITLPTNDYREVTAYSTQWQALARQEARIWLDFNVTNFDKHPDTNLKHMRDVVQKVFQCNPPLRPSSIDCYLRIYLNNRRRIWHDFYVLHGESKMEPTCTKDAWPKLVKMWKSPVFERKSERMSKSAMIQVRIRFYEEDHENLCF
jgi:hypothetical protein